MTDPNRNTSAFLGIMPLTHAAKEGDNSGSRILVGVASRLWHKTAVPIFIERYLLPALATITIGLSLLNPMKFDWTQRITLGLAVLLFAYFLAHSLHLYNQSVRQQPAVSLPMPTPPTSAAQLEATPALKPEPLTVSKTEAKSDPSLPPEKKERKEMKSNSSDSEDATKRSESKSPSGTTVTSINQSGGITAGTVNLTDIPPPKISVSRVVQNHQTEGGLYETDFVLTIDSKVPVANLFVRVDAASIVHMEAGPRRTGGFMTGHSGKREGWAFTNVPNANGQYDVRVVTKNPETCRLTYSVE